MPFPLILLMVPKYTPKQVPNYDSNNKHKHRSLMSRDSEVKGKATALKSQLTKRGENQVKNAPDDIT